MKTGDAVSASVAPLPEVPYDVPHADPVELGIPVPGHTMPPDAGMHDAPVDNWHLNVLSDPTPSEKAIPLGTVTVVPVHS